MNTMVPWAGTIFYYKAHRGKHSPEPADDLVALVRSAYLMYSNANPTGVAGIGTVRAMDASPLWRQALEYARACQYDSLMAFFNRL